MNDEIVMTPETETAGYLEPPPPSAAESELETETETETESDVILEDPFFPFSAPLEDEEVIISNEPYLDDTGLPGTPVVLESAEEPVSYVEWFAKISEQLERIRSDISFAQIAPLDADLDLELESESETETEPETDLQVLLESLESENLAVLDKLDAMMLQQKTTYDSYTTFGMIGVVALGMSFSALCVLIVSRYLHP